MTNKEFLALEKRLLASFPGFAIKGPLMLIPPVEHTLKGFHFEGSSFDKTSFYIWKFFLPLCIPTEHINFGLGDRLRDNGGDRWSVEDPNFETRLASAMRKEVTFLEALRTPQDIVIAIESSANPKGPHQCQALAYMLIRAGKWSEATKVLDDLVQMLDTTVPWQQEMALRAQPLKSKLSGSPEEARDKLLAWEAETIRNLGLESFLTVPLTAN